jgi:hypothetical protein
MRCNVLSAGGRSTTMSIPPSSTSDPAASSIPRPRSTGSSSPVSIDSSTLVVPRVIRASAGTRSPGRRRSAKPASMESAGIVFSLPSGRSCVASIGAFFRSPWISSSVRASAKCSSAEDRLKRKRRIAPSANWPSDAAPSATAIMRKCTSSTSLRIFSNTSIVAAQPPAMYEITQSALASVLPSSASAAAIPAMPHAIAEASCTRQDGSHSSCECGAL